MTPLSIRPETAVDMPAIYQVNKLAFGRDDVVFVLATLLTTRVLDLNRRVRLVFGWK